MFADAGTAPLTPKVNELVVGLNSNTSRVLTPATKTKFPFSAIVLGPVIFSGIVEPTGVSTPVVPFTLYMESEEAPLLTTSANLSEGSIAIAVGSDPVATGGAGWVSVPSAAIAN